MTIPLKNPEAEKIAQDLADCLPDKEEAASVFNSWRANKPDLKKWEISAIGSRVIQIYKERN